MGRNLFIRVSAVTYSEEDVAKRWPRLHRIAWSDDSDKRPEKELRSLGITSRGVLELAARVEEQFTYGKETASLRSGAEAALQLLARHVEQLEEALGNRDVPTAHGLTNAIEDALDALENYVKENPA